MVSNNRKKHQRQFKENENHGEHRNGRLSPFKNNNGQGKEEPNEYISYKRED